MRNINLIKYFYNLIIFTTFFLLFFFLIMVSYNFINKKKYIYNINNFYHAIPNSIENYQNEDQKIINKIVRITNDENGFRNKKKSIDGKNILFLGDSLIRAINTDDDKILSNILNMPIYNAGMDGFSTFNSLNVASHLFKKKKFKKIFLFFNLNNDFRDNVYQEVYEKNFKGKAIIVVKNNQFLDRLFKLRFLFIHKNKENNKILRISEIDKPYYSINYLKLLVNDEIFINKATKKTLIAFKDFKNFSIKNNSELVIIGIPNVSEIYKDIHKVPRLAKDLKIENLDIENFKDKLNFENPKKIFFSVCKKANVNCFYLPLDKYSYYELDDEHWNDHGQRIAKDYLIKQLNLRR
jgi:hypothetical protein